MYRKFPSTPLSLLLVVAFAAACTETEPTAPSAEGLTAAFSFTLNGCDAIVEAGESIQEAIDAASPGATICVEAGTYAEALTVDKDIVLLGAQHGVDARDRNETESVINSPGGNAITITDDADLTLDGFHLDEVLRFVLTEDVGAGSPDPSGWGDLDLRNNIFTNAESATGGYFWLRDDPGENLTFHQNYLTDNDELSNGLRIRAIQRSEPGAGLVNVDISDNLWEDNAGWALNVNNIEGVISGNVVQNTSGNQWGFLLATEGTDLVMEANEFEGLTSWPVALAFGFSGTLVGTENVFTDNAGGIVATAGQDVEDVVFNFNEFDGNGTGVSNHAENAPFDATCNWWGAADGPGGEGPGSGDTVAGNVDFMPWSTDSEDIEGSCVGGLEPEDPEECMDGGWEEFGFRNQGQCIRFVNTGEDSR